MPYQVNPSVMAIANEIIGEAKEQNCAFDPRVLVAQVDLESGGNIKAVSSDFPCGLAPGDSYPPGSPAGQGFYTNFGGSVSPGSSQDPAKNSHSYGLFQMTPTCGYTFGMSSIPDAINALFDRDFAIEHGVAEMISLYNSNSGMIGEALTAYNSGNPSSTTNYTKAILDRLLAYQLAIPTI
ncbi:MAG: transglycosylase SLT domain-containing protein [Nitrososphaerales archaeon]